MIKLKKSENKVNKIFTLEDTQHLSSYEISDIIGNYSKEDIYTGKKYYNNFSSLNYFTLTIV